MNRQADDIDEKFIGAPDRYWLHDKILREPYSGPTRRAISELQITLFKKVIQDIDATICFDIGAHSGEFSRQLAVLLPRSRIIAFEPNPYIYSSNFDKLAELSNVQYILSAASDKTGLAVLEIPTNVAGVPRPKYNTMASLLSHVQSQSHIRFSVPSFRLDDLCSQLFADSDKAIAWIDVEGAIGPVLSGGPAFFRTIDALYVELETAQTWLGQTTDKKAIDLLESSGLTPFTRDVERPRQYNALFLRLSSYSEDQIREYKDIFHHNIATLLGYQKVAD